MKYLLIVAMVLFSGCVPVQGFVNGGWLGDDYKNTLHRMELIVKHSALVYDPSITDAEFAEWKARNSETYIRFKNLMELYAILAPPEAQSETQDLERLMNETEEAFDAIVASR